ncbi:MAG: hypothetical protein V3V01_03965 [Acidimicrobiales bacterium]
MSDHPGSFDPGFALKLLVRLEDSVGGLRSEFANLRSEVKIGSANLRSEMFLMERALNPQARTGMALTVGSTLSTWGLIITLSGVFG